MASSIGMRKVRMGNKGDGIKSSTRSPSSLTTIDGRDDVETASSIFHRRSLQRAPHVGDNSKQPRISTLVSSSARNIHTLLTVVFVIIFAGYNMLHHNNTNLNNSGGKSSFDRRNIKVTPDHSLTDYVNTCQEENTNFHFRTVTVRQSPSYRMVVYPPGKDVYISDKVFDSNGEQIFERHIQLLMEQQLRKCVPSKTVVLDIGANIGTHALHLASMGYLVHAFEPSPENFNLLKCSKVVNQFDNLVLNNFGLSTEDAELCLKVSENNHGYAQLNNDECPKAEKVVIKKLDNYFDRVLKGKSPDALKIDIEGYELFALRGGEKMFKQDPPRLIFAEVTPEWFEQHDQSVEQFYDFFWSYDYTIYIVWDKYYLLKIERGQVLIPPSHSIYVDQYDVLIVHQSILDNDPEHGRELDEAGIAVSVTGAGSSEVNGCYTLKGKNENAWEFEFVNAERTFEIFRTSGDWWNIMESVGGAYPNPVLYGTNGNNDAELPPIDGWGSTKYNDSWLGMVPMPKVEITDKKTCLSLEKVKKNF